MPRKKIVNSRAGLTKTWHEHPPNNFSDQRLATGAQIADLFAAFPLQDDYVAVALKTHDSIHAVLHQEYVVETLEVVAFRGLGPTLFACLGIVECDLRLVSDNNGVCISQVIDSAPHHSCDALGVVSPGNAAACLSWV